MSPTVDGRTISDDDDDDDADRRRSGASRFEENENVRRETSLHKISIQSVYPAPGPAISTLPNPQWRI